ncbi:uncharacterized protein LOC133295883 isoform X2 [Gastrolobium bilobum]|uniref:uncharacterized protein LOC133295883 isoform X2 n=1 Tax=Gastrolobium bilobum TaxID=150636 RepID=UPI002AB1F9ED|nr:uncharacterized protein LOC133295883 isoform X2 [Gastrolobium bilobum]
MSAIVCGKRSALFEDLPSSSSPPLSKRIRCSSSSPHRFSLIHHLTAFFPDMDNQLLEKTLEECGNDLDSALRSLNELRLGGSVQKSLDSADIGSDAAVDLNAQLHPEVAASDDPVAGQNYPINGAEWVELFVKEMMNSSNMDDAKARASRVLEVLEKSICERASAETEMNFHQENMMLKEQVEALIQENIILKRAVCIQNERLKESEDRKEESKHLKQLVSQYQERLRTLEVNNYALTMHLKQAEQSSSIPGRFHPDVF